MRDAGPRRLRVVFIKPSKYDDAGRVQHFWRGILPNNTLTVLAALNETYAALRKDRVRLDTVIWDEHVDGPIDDEVIAGLQREAATDGAALLIGLAGVQTNQYPRGRDLALRFRRAGLPVLFGGFHVSSHPPSRAFLERCGITTVVGEAETIWADVVDDVLAGRLRASYRVEDGIQAKTGAADITVPLIDEAQLPSINQAYMARFGDQAMTTLDTSRGCPFTCSYCSVKNVMGRTMRSRDAAAVVRWVRDAVLNHGVRSLFIVDDDFYRSPAWEPILAGMAQLRAEGHELSFMMQVDAEAAAFEPDGPETSQRRKSERFMRLAADAGCFAAFIGFESFSPQNLLAAGKVQNLAKAQRRLRSGLDTRAALDAVKAKYRRVCDNWHRHGVAVHAGYMLGFPYDGPDCGRESAEWLHEVGVDLATFFIVTPLPGTEDHDKAVADGAITDWDFNNYDSQHMVSRHPHMAHAEVMAAYRDAYRTFYSWKNTLRSILTRHRVAGLGMFVRTAMWRQRVYYFYSYRAGRHPMLGGLWQRSVKPSARRRVVTDEEARTLYLGDVPATFGTLDETRLTATA